MYQTLKILQGNAKVTLAVKRYPQQSDTVTSLSPFTINSTTDKKDTRARGRFVNIKIENTDVSESWRFGTLRIDIQPDGTKIMAIPFNLADLIKATPANQVVDQNLVNARNMFGIDDDFLLKDYTDYYMDKPPVINTNEGIVSLPVNTNVINQGEVVEVVEVYQFLI